MSVPQACDRSLGHVDPIVAELVGSKDPDASVLPLELLGGRVMPMTGLRVGHDRDLPVLLLRKTAKARGELDTD